MNHRVGFLYGRFNEDTSVKVEVIYEPPQETTDTSFTLLQDSKEVCVCVHLDELLFVNVLYKLRIIELSVLTIV